MGETKASQKQVKSELDAKLTLAAPSREILEELAIGAASNPSPDNTFQYAFCLSKSTEKAELRYAVTILDGLLKEGYEHQMDCMYGAACALYLLGEYEQARVSKRKLGIHAWLTTQILLLVGLTILNHITSVTL
jgi:fission 1 protein